MTPNSGIGRRIAVVGSTGSGKTTMAVALAERLGARHVELDALYWGPGWIARDTGTFRGLAAAALAGDTWVVDGNYHALRDIVWKRADTLVWLDFSLPTILVRLVRRTAYRIWSQTELWNDNRESLRSFFSRESILLWALKTHHRRRRQFTQLLAGGDFAHLTVVRLRSQAEVDRWMATIRPAVRDEHGPIPAGDNDP